MVDAVTAQLDPYTVRLTRLTLVWVLTALVLFPILAVLGLLMRTMQSGYFQAVAPEWFYAAMTLHGLGMVGLWFVAGMAGVSFLLAKYVRPTLAVSWIAFGATLIGVVLLLAATLVCRLAWGYFLPAPFPFGGTWPPGPRRHCFPRSPQGVVGPLGWRPLLRRVASTRSPTRWLAYLVVRTPEVRPSSSSPRDVIGVLRVSSRRSSSSRWWLSSSSRRLQNDALPSRPCLFCPQCW